MILLNLLSIQLLISTALVDGNNCALINPPKTAGETQAHGVILYIHPRNHAIDEQYSGCQNKWFLDDNHFRKLSVIHYINGTPVSYDNINLHGDIGYQCWYKTKKLTGDSDKRCPEFKLLRKKTYQAGCYSSSEFNSSDSYEVYSKDCVYQ